MYATGTFDFFKYFSNASRAPSVEAQTQTPYFDVLIDFLILLSSDLSYLEAIFNSSSLWIKYSFDPATASERFSAAILTPIAPFASSISLY